MHALGMGAILKKQKCAHSLNRVNVEVHISMVSVKAEMHGTAVAAHIEVRWWQARSCVLVW